MEVKVFLSYVSGFSLVSILKFWIFLCGVCWTCFCVEFWFHVLWFGKRTWFVLCWSSTISTHQLLQQIAVFFSFTFEFWWSCFFYHPLACVCVFSFWFWSWIRIVSWNSSESIIASIFHAISFRFLLLLWSGFILCSQ